MKHLSVSFRFLIAGIILFAGTLAHSQSYPSGPIRIIVPYSPGGPPDAHARYIADRLQNELKETFIVESRAGAGGTLALDELVRSPADGRTLEILAAPQMATPVLYPHAKVSIDRDIEPVAQIAWQYNVLVVPTSSGVRTLADLVAKLKAKSGKASYASGGTGTPAHILGELFKKKADVDVVHVPYNNFGQAITDTISGEVDFMFMAVTAAKGQIANGRLRALGVAGPDHLSALPDIKTMAELGYPDVALAGWTGIIVKSGTNQAYVNLLSKKITQIMAKEHTKAALDVLGDVPAPVPHDKFKAYVASQFLHWTSLTRSLGLSAN